MHRFASLAGAAAVAAAALSGPLAAQAADSAARPTLVVVLTVDQLRGDYFARWDRQLTGGLARLARGGAHFTRAYQDHANTETAPGHASVLSGRFPRGTGIVANALGVGDPQAPLIAGASGPGASPFRFRGSGLVDWMRLRDPRTRALSVSRKDRGAILPLGRAKQQVFWYGLPGVFTTSTYYADTLPDWVRRFNARQFAPAYAGRSWTLLLPESEYPEPDYVAAEGAGQENIFPHVMPADSAQAARALLEFPWIDDETMALALEGVRAMGLGEGPQTDVLAVSLSATDAIGHRYGPDSRELHDQVLRLDRALGAFLDSLFVLRDSTRTLVVLTADHGVTPLVDAPRDARGTTATYGDGGAERYRVDLAPAFRTAFAPLEGRVDSGAVWLEDGMLYVRRERTRRAGGDVDAAVRRFLEAARRIPGVLRADRLRDLAKDTARDPIARRWLHMIPPDFPVEAVVTQRPYSIFGNYRGAAHGSPHDYDAHVPVIFYGPAFRAGRYDDFARTADIAPTLAAALGVTPTEPLDGRPLRRALR